MAVTATPIFAQTPFASSLSMTAQTACSTRAPTATASLAAANIVEFVATSTNGLRIDSIQVNACGTGISTANAANIVGIWLWDGTTARLINEILVTAVTPSASAVAAFTTTFTFAQPLNLPSTYKLFASVGVTTTAAGTALMATAFGGAY
jgi:hypothetical protein